MKQRQAFNPSKLRTLLAFLLVVVTLGGGALFYWGVTMVQAYAVTVDQRAVDAVASGNQIQELQLLKSQLAQSNSLVEKANQVFASPATYQSQALNDIRAYADAAGLSIASTAFGDPGQGGGYTMTLSFDEPVSYSKLIAFLNNVEGNLPKMQVSELSLGYDAGGGNDSVTVGEIKIDIAVR